MTKADKVLQRPNNIITPRKCLSYSCCVTVELSTILLVSPKVLGVVHRENLGFDNRKLFDSFDVRVALAKVFRRYRPRLVLGLGAKTPLASPDHAQAVAITEAAVFYSRLTKWDDIFDGLPVYTVPQFLTYFLFAGLSDVPHGHWPLVIGINDFLGKH